MAASIGAGLAKAALGGKVDGQLVDTSYLLSRNASVAIVTAKDPDGLELIRHSTAHLLAYAVKQLHPTAQVTIGPVIENGFYYDFSYHRPFTPEDLQQIEDRMKMPGKSIDRYMDYAYNWIGWGHHGARTSYAYDYASRLITVEV